MSRARVLLLNSALGPLDYRVPHGMTVEPGSIVLAPLGPRQLAGVVWEPAFMPSDAEVGDTAPVQLEVTSRADHLAWPLGGAIGSLLVLLAVTRLEHDRRRSDSPHHEDVATQASGAAAD